MDLNKKGLTLIELLVVIGMIALLAGIFVPSLAQARLRAKIVTVNSDLRQIALALECYYFDHQEYPPTREDCNMGTLSDHLYQLPDQLAKGSYLPAAGEYEVMSTVMEDRFHRGYTYKYRSVGECIRDRDMIHKRIKSRLWVPQGFPANNSTNEAEGQWYNDPKESPVSWTLFSLGPQFDESWLAEQSDNRYPASKEVWFQPDRRKGLLVRLRLKNGTEIGSFEGL